MRQAAPWLSDNDWMHLSDTLDGLMCVEFPSPFTNLELRCPKEVWLVVQLADVHANATDFRPQLMQVFHALTRLLIHAEALRPWSDLFEAFWTRVLASGMIQRPSGHDGTDVTGYIRFVRANGAHIALRWCDRSLNLHDVIDPIYKWLQTTVDMPRLSSFVPAHIALRFENCQLTPKRLKQLHQLLRTPEAVGAKPFLCQPTTLRELSLSCNVLHAHQLREVELMLHDPSTRRIDGLKLDATVPEQAHQTPAYTTAFRRMLTAAVNFMSTSPSAIADDRGVALSVENCTIFHAAQVEVMIDVLSQATRPLRALSLACCRFPDQRALERVGRLIVANLPTATEEFDLDVSCLRGPQEPIGADRWVMDARAELIKDAALAAQGAGRSITCRPLHFAEAFPNSDVEVTLCASTYYPVREVMDCGCCVIGVVVAGAEVRCTVEPDSIANVCIDGVYVIRDGASGLIIDRCKHPDAGHERGVTITTLAAGLVARVTRLSTRHNRWDWESYSSWRRWLSWSLELLEFNGEGCRDWHDLFESVLWTCKRLQVVNVADSSSTSSARNRFGVVASSPAETFRRVLDLPSLWSLRFARNDVYNTELRLLLHKLRETRVLSFVDLRHTGVDELPADTPGGQLVAQIETLLQSERVSTRARDAFLLVARRLFVHGAAALIPREVASRILLFAGASERPRVVLW